MNGNQGDRGGVLVVMLLAVLTLAAGISALVHVEGRRTLETGGWSERERAFTLARGGVDEVSAFLNADPLWAGPLDWSIDGIDNDGDGIVDEPGETVFATAVNWSNDGLDNDVDGDVDEQDEQVARVFSRATVGNSTRLVTGYLKRLTANLPAPPAGLVLNDPLAQVNFNGVAFLVTGNDTYPDGTPGTGPPVYGIAINGDPQQVIGQLTPQQYPQVTGIGAPPSVGSYGPVAANFVYSLVQTYSPFADLTYGPGATTIANAWLGTPPTGPLWDNGVYKISYSNGNLTMTGGGQGTNSGGAGMLLVKGNLVVTGNWLYVGYVLVTGTVEFKGGGNKRLAGTMFVGGDAQGYDILGSGGVEILYSSLALNNVLNALARWTVVSVSENEP